MDFHELLYSADTDDPNRATFSFMTGYSPDYQRQGFPRKLVEAGQNQLDTDPEGISFFLQLMIFRPAVLTHRHLIGTDPAVRLHRLYQSYYSHDLWPAQVPALQNWPGLILLIG